MNHEINIGERGLRLMKMTEDYTKWGEMFKELREHRKTDPDCAAILGFCYYWGMGTFCNLEKTRKYYSLARERGCEFLREMDTPEGKLKYAHATNLKYFTMRADHTCLSFEQLDELRNYPPYLCQRASDMLYYRLMPEYHEFFRACQPSGIHHIFTGTPEARRHSYDTAKQILSQYNMAPLDVAFVDLNNLVPTTWEISVLTISGIAIVVQSIKVLNLPIHHLHLKVLPDNNVIDLIGQVNITKLTLDINYDCFIVKPDLFKHLFCQLVGVTNLRICRTFGTTNALNMLESVTHLFVPGGSQIRRLKIEFDQTKLSPEFRRTLAMNHKLKVGHINPDNHLLVIVWVCLNSLFPAWYPSQLRNLVISQIWYWVKCKLFGL